MPVTNTHTRIHILYMCTRLNYNKYHIRSEKGPDKGLIIISTLVTQLPELLNLLEKGRKWSKVVKRLKVV